MVSLFDILGRDFTLFEIRTTIHHGADVNEIEFTTQQTPLSWMMQVGHPNVEAIKYMLDSNADPNGNPNHRETPLHLAAQFNHTAKAAKLLVENKCRVNQQDAAGNTALHLAVSENEHTEVANYLIAAGADLEILNYNGMTVYELAKRAGFVNKKNMLKLQRAYNRVQKNIRKLKEDNA